MRAADQRKNGGGDAEPTAATSAKLAHAGRLNYAADAMLCCVSCDSPAPMRHQRLQAPVWLLCGGLRGGLCLTPRMAKSSTSRGAAARGSEGFSAIPGGWRLGWSDGHAGHPLAPAAAARGRRRPRCGSGARPGYAWSFLRTRGRARACTISSSTTTSRIIRRSPSLAVRDDT